MGAALLLLLLLLLFAEGGFFVAVDVGVGEEGCCCRPKVLRMVFVFSYLMKMGVK